MAAGDLDVMEVLLPSDEVLPALAAVMAVGTLEVCTTELRGYCLFTPRFSCSFSHAA